MMRMARWSVTGTLTIALDVMIFHIAYRATGSVLASNAIGMPIVTVFNYLMHHQWSFNAHRTDDLVVGRYLLVLAAGFILNSVIVKVALLAGAGPGLAKLVAVPIHGPINYLLLSAWVFPKPNQIKKSSTEF